MVAESRGGPRTRDHRRRLRFQAGVPSPGCRRLGDHRPAPGRPPRGFTATSLASLAADPPMATFNMARSARAWPAIEQTEHVIVHLLGIRNRAVAETLSSRSRAAIRRRPLGSWAARAALAQRRARVDAVPHRRPLSDRAERHDRRAHRGGRARGAGRPAAVPRAPYWQPGDRV